MSIGSWHRVAPLGAGDFPAETPLCRFFAWNEAAGRKDRRYIIARDICTLLRAFGGGEAAHAMCVAHLSRRPLVALRLGGWVSLQLSAADRTQDGATVAAARELVDGLLAAIGAADEVAHAAVFAGFEALSAEIDLDAMARHWPRLLPAKRLPTPRRILVIRLSALGDFVQSLGPFAAIRHHHAADHVALLTTEPFANFAAGLGCFDEVLIDRRPKPSALNEWWALRRQLRQGWFDRVYDLQTSQRSSNYLRLFASHGRPEWSGIAPGSSHPHANLDRDRQHTIDKQAEQLLMAGIHPTPLPRLPVALGELPLALAGRDFVVLVPGSSPHRPAKRWPASRYGELARQLSELGYVPVVVGTAEERALAAQIREACPDAIDLIGQTGLGELTALTRGARLTVGNDTGVCHLAAASGVPVVVLFSAESDPALCAPRGDRVQILAVADLGELGIDAVLAASLAVMSPVPCPVEAAPA
jgi:ADP-heptose:LPS heptosyltransferase